MALVISIADPVMRAQSPSCFRQI